MFFSVKVRKNTTLNLFLNLLIVLHYQNDAIFYKRLFAFTQQVFRISNLFSAVI